MSYLEAEKDSNVCEDQREIKLNYRKDISK